MSFLYQLISGLLLAAALPLLLLHPKRRRRIGARLGLGLGRAVASLPDARTGPTIWLHALSVGEVTSALPLVRGLRAALPDACLICSASTRSGEELARSLLGDDADLVIAAPLDLGPVVPFFCRTIRPALFILVETDFWPHWLHVLASRRVSLLLVNGRFSAASFRRYQRLSLLFGPMFRRFDLLSMQTENDVRSLRELGVDADRIRALGNLKFDTSRLIRQPETDREQARIAHGFAPAALLWICGSTHPGEEEIIVQAYLQVRRTIADLQLLLAPRSIDRAGEIVALASRLGLRCRLRSADPTEQGPLLVLDTIGELAGCYAMADLAFIGGTLVACGGHNPIEPAAAAVPVLFGPHMEDFAEIARELLDCGGAWQVDSQATLVQALLHLLTRHERRQAMATAARAFVVANEGVVDAHLQAVSELLGLHGSGR
ncbi:MAG: 3-deoxy-D-manno-octulosonic acid transferase [Desulfobulbus sp.]